MKAKRPDKAVDVIARVLVSVALLVDMGAKGSVAQEAPQPILTAQFSFSNPGARSLGLGGAFVALADDATAAWANPAGLVQIASPELSAEGRFWSYCTPFVVGGRVLGEPTGIGLDTIRGLRTEDSESHVAGLAFLSFVYPHDRWSIAVYRHVLANVESEGDTEGLFAGGEGWGPVRFLDQRSRSDLTIISYGLSGAYRITDAVSLGVGLIYYQTFLEIQSDLYLWDDFDDFLGSGTSYLPEHLVAGQTLFGDEGSVGLSGGFLWRIDSRWSLGGRYRQGPTMLMGGEGRVGSILDLGLPPGTVVDFEFEEEAEFPDNYGLGVAYRSDNGRLTIGFEWDRVTYSDSLESLEIEDQEIDDGDQFHLGGEWAILETKPILAVRVGAWHDPDHQTRANERADDFTRALLQPGKDEVHFALGLGAAFKSFQIDGAVDISDSVKTLSLSAIYSF